jgi:ligand-binding sensor domain-containing protein
MLWLATSGGLYRFNPSTGETIRFQHDPNNPFSLSSNAIKYAGEDKEGTLWVASSEGVDAFDWRASKVTLHIPLHEQGEMSFHEDRFGVLWIVHVTGAAESKIDMYGDLPYTSFQLLGGQNYGAASGDGT